MSHRSANVSSNRSFFKIPSFAMKLGNKICINIDKKRDPNNCKLVIQRIQKIDRWQKKRKKIIKIFRKRILEFTKKILERHENTQRVYFLTSSV